jgi:lipopolysaccharide/colanic/teichoic acid biosynthesis glycosyltransferase
LKSITMGQPATIPRSEGIGSQSLSLRGLRLVTSRVEATTRENQRHFRAGELAIKRAIDVFLACLVILALFPLIAAVAGAIKVDSRGPVFYASPRVGRKGAVFTCYKFRTMRPDADFFKPGLRLRNERSGAFFKMHDDPRVTRLGRWLRRYSLDELPQLWNVLRGEMSLVGPRPHPLDDVARYNPGDRRRLDCTPGITGLWQVTARNDPSFRRCVVLDLEYIEHWSLGLDFQILAKTFSAVLSGSGQ